MAEIKKYLDQEGVALLWSKINMQDYPNNKTLISIIEAIDETKADKLDLNTLRSNIPTKVSQLTNDSGYALKTEIPEQVQADWNQIDESAIDYIKNKPQEVSEDEFLAWLNDENIVSPMASATGELYVTNNNEIYVL